MAEAVRVSADRETGVARVSLARPPLNLLEPGLIAELRETFANLARDDAIRVVVISGEGRAFSAGMDVKVLRDLDVASAHGLISALRDAIEAVLKAPFVTIASIEGACLGGAFELALACDLRAASEGALFGLPEVRVGVPSVIHAALLPRMVPAAIASEMLLGGAPLSAREARAAGLVNRVAPADELEVATQALVDAVLACAPNAVRLQKELIIGWREASLSDSIAMSVDVFSSAFETGEPREGAAAFLEKREPRWGG